MSEGMKLSGLTGGLSLGAEDVDVHGREDVGVDNTLATSCLLSAWVDGVGGPVSPEERVLKQSEGKRVRQLTFNHHLPENTQHVTVLKKLITQLQKP